MIAITRLATVIALATGTVSAAPLLAAPIEGQAIVQTADLDLASGAGAATLHARIDRAATRVCGQADIRDLGAQRAVAQCRVAALATAQPQMELALANARSGRQFAANQVRMPATGF